MEEWAVRIIQGMYKDVKSRVRVNSQYSKEFGVGVGVYQGSVLSPLLFIIEAWGLGVRHSSHLLPTPVPGTPAAVEK